MKEERASRILRTGHLKVGCMPCKVRKKTMITRCFRCQGSGHVASSCKDPDRTKACRTCGAEGHKSVEGVSTPQYFLCPACTEKPRTDHRSGSIRCMSFREAALSWKPPKGQK
ncbi:cellular nucleic acid-binding protein homolog [Belonocnema kinseyi]|uniref:cellular nucleic acid-binding protein homolog n=1 Tax=Belonocnema kinseyi TaxID=2817044 RepID=UPI00143DDE72|nr:cellular nucleic acid-binding protein homolog [Belonocnema kinseyi]